MSYRRTAATWIAQRQGDLVSLTGAIPELARRRTIARRLPDDTKNDDPEGPPKLTKVHGKGVEPLRLAAAEPKSAASASFATRAVSLSGIRGVILAEGSALESSGMSAWSGPNSPKLHVRAFRRYLSIIVCPSWPVRSETHVSVLPVARAIVTKVARRSCARKRWRVPLLSKSWRRVIPTRRRSLRIWWTRCSTLAGTPSSAKTGRLRGEGRVRRGSSFRCLRCRAAGRTTLGEGGVEARGVPHWIDGGLALLLWGFGAGTGREDRSLRQRIMSRGESRTRSKAEGKIKEWIHEGGISARALRKKRIHERRAWIHDGDNVSNALAKRWIHR